jgi:DNA topoisomerase I
MAKALSKGTKSAKTTKSPAKKAVKAVAKAPKKVDVPVIRKKPLKPTIKNLMIVESPAKAKTIEKYLGADFIVKASYGHVRDLTKGNKAIDIEGGFLPKYEVLEDKEKIIDELRKLSDKSEHIWLATDEDREGEAISWHLAEVLGIELKDAQRVVFNEITKKAIQKAIEKPRLIDINLVNAQQARRVLDRIVGFQLSPILWSKIRTGLSAGRVQSVAVRIIVERERDITQFNSESHFKVFAEFDLGGGVKLKAELNQKFNEEKEAQKFLEECIGANYSIKNLESKPAKKSPSAPFTTSTLQQEASRKLGFSVAQTMRVAQTLYEGGKISYMRTDSVNLSEDAREQARNMIHTSFGEKYHQPRTFKSKVANAQEAHEAIRPTDFTVQEVPGDRNEKRLYELIWKRTIASQMADAALEKTTATIEISTRKENFIAVGEVMKFDGFLKVYIEERDEDSDEEGQEGMLPPLKVGQVLKHNNSVARERFSRPPARYTEASLVKKLEELGIGRPSTYAPTISTIQKREYVVKDERQGNLRDYRELILAAGKVTREVLQENTGVEKAKLFPTDLGMMVVDFLVENFPQVLDFSFTAQVEEEFDEIATGTLRWNKMLETFYKDFSKTVIDTKENAERVNKEQELGVDPKTGRKITARFGRYGPFVQIEPEKEGDKPKYASLRSDQRLETITLEDALELFKMPRMIGEFEGEQMKVNIGRFGPYVQVGKTYFSIPKGEDPYSLTYERALEIIEAKRHAEANKLIADFGDDIQILRGRYGPYVKYKELNLRIPKDKDPEKLTLEDCHQLHEEQKDKPKRGKFTKKKS